MSIFTFICIFSFISSFAVGLIFFIKGNKRILNSLLGLTFITSSLFTLGAFKFSLTNSQEIALFWVKIAHVGIILSPVFYFHFIFKLTNSTKKWLIGFVYAMAGVFLILNFFDKDFHNLRFVFNEFYFFSGDIKKNPAYVAFYVFFYWIVLFSSFLVLLRFFIKIVGLQREQIKYLILGSIIGWLAPEGMFLLVLGLPLYPYSNILIGIYPLIFAYAILKYRLLDIKIAFTRAGIFIVVYTLVLGIPFFFGYRYGLWQLATWITVIFATAGPFIYLSLSRRAEASIQAEEQRARDLLKQASDGMLRIRSLKRLISLMVHVTCKILKLGNAALFLLNEEKGLYDLKSTRLKSKYKYPESLGKDDPLVHRLATAQEPLVYEEIKIKSQELKADLNNPIHEIVSQMHNLSAAVIIPAACWGRLLGFLILGEKKSKRVFSREDLNVLHVLSNQAALAIENAFFWQKEEQRVIEASQEEAVSHVTYGAGHQFNNRLYAISMAADGFLIIMKGKDIEQTGNDELKGLLNAATGKFNKIIAECEFGGQITAGIMSFTGRTPANFKEFDLSEIIASSLEYVAMKHSQDKVEGNQPVVDISCQIEESLPKIIGSDAQIRDCIFNLVDNSYDAAYKKDELIKAGDSELMAAVPELVKHTESQPYLPQIRVHAFTKDSSVFITVTDNGIGVKDEDRKRLFAGFFTTKATGVKGRGRGGHGIGLFTIKSMILAHKGKLSFNSDYGRSTTFTIELPLGPKGKEGKENA